MTDQTLSVSFLNMVKHNEMQDIDFYLRNDHFIDFSLCDHHGNNSLFYSVYNNNKTIFDFIIKKDIDINKKNLEGHTVLMLCIIYNNYYMFEKILDHKKIDINIPDKNGDTAIFYSVKKNNSKMTEDLLINLNLNIDIKNNNGRCVKFYIDKNPILKENLKGFCKWILHS